MSAISPARGDPEESSRRSSRPAPRRPHRAPETPTTARFSTPRAIDEDRRSARRAGRPGRARCSRRPVACPARAPCCPNAPPVEPAPPDRLLDPANSIAASTPANWRWRRELQHPVCIQALDRGQVEGEGAVRSSTSRASLRSGSAPGAVRWAATPLAGRTMIIAAAAAHPARSWRIGDAAPRRASRARARRRDSRACRPRGGRRGTDRRSGGPAFRHLRAHRPHLRDRLNAGTRRTGDAQPWKHRRARSACSTLAAHPTPPHPGSRACVPAAPVV